MALESLHGSTVNVRFNTGTKPGDGTMIVRTVSLGRMDADATAGQIMAVVAELGTVAKWPLVNVERRTTTRLEF